MIDFPISELLDEAACVRWLEQHLHPDGFVCPHCGSTDRRLFREQGYFPAYRCRRCDGYYTLLTDTAFAKTRQSPSRLVLLLRGISKGEPTARLARELRMDRKHLGALRHRLQENLYDTLPADVMTGVEFEADELYQNAGEKIDASSGPARPTPPACQQAKRARHVRQ
jgi:transposase-like protein